MGSFKVVKPPGVFPLNTPFVVSLTATLLSWKPRAIVSRRLTSLFHSPSHWKTVRSDGQKYELRSVQLQLPHAMTNRLNRIKMGQEEAKNWRPDKYGNELVTTRTVTWPTVNPLRTTSCKKSQIMDWTFIFSHCFINYTWRDIFPEINNI